MLMYYHISFVYDGVSKLTKKLTKDEKEVLIESLFAVSINNAHQVSNVTIHKTL